MAVDRRRYLAQHLRLLESHERSARYFSRRLLVRHGKLAATGFEEGGAEGATIALRDGEKEVRELLARLYPPTISTFSKRVFEMFREPQVSVFELLVLEFIRKYALESAKLIHGTTVGAIVTTIALGRKEGVANKVIAKMIREQALSLSRVRANAIARTETHNAATFASQTAARATNLRLEKEWIAVVDDRTRGAEGGDGHVGTDGQRRKMDEPYRVEGFSTVPAASMMRPGDRGAPGGHVINCRCGELYHRVGEDVAAPVAA